MAGVVPKTVAEEIIEARRAVEEKMYSTYVVDEFSTALLKRKVEKELSRSGISPAYRAVLHHELAYLFGVPGRYRESVQQMELMAKSGFEPIAVAFSSAHISIISGYVLRARKIIEEVSNSGGFPVSSNSLLAALQVQTGMLESAIKIVGPGAEELKHIEASVRILNRIGVEDLELTKRLDTACRVIRDQISHPIMGFKIFAMEGEGILYRYVVKAPVDDLIALNDKVLDALIDNHDGPLDQELSICVTPWSSDEVFSREEAHHVSFTR
ncbi:hypothetical protein [Pseudomonas kurunegalensis]|jgi:hypothetical protein|uniref:hypothetical protein n=1 Tax=Pseudomonas kurunegalensis TaxID=485880 RepID=UPI0021185408|nr:hypothetical protein [Pseudomonas kurunegalensis]